jgi:hypothetical protein
MVVGLSNNLWLLGLLALLGLLLLGNKPMAA